MRKIKTGIVGCGAVGHFHARAFQQLPGSELTACCNVRLGRAQEFGAQYGIPAFDSVSEMIRKTGVEALSICTPHPAHREFAVEAARLGVHIAVEKPLASSLSDCDAMIEATQRGGALGATISQRRFYPPARRVKQAIEAGKIGKPILGSVNMLGWRTMEYYASAEWRGTWQGEGGGVLVNQAVHQLDLLLWYMGEAREVYGMWDTLNHPSLEVEDTAVAVVRFANGALGSISVSNSQNPALFGNVRVHGENGASIGVQTDGGAMFIAGQNNKIEPPFNDLWTVPGEEHLKEQWKTEDAACFAAPDAIEQFHVQQLDDFLHAIDENRAPAITLQDGRRTVELFTAIYQSGRDHRPVTLPLSTSRDSDMDGRLK